MNQARLLLTKFVLKKRFIKPKGSVKDIANRSISAMLKLLLDPALKLPALCAKNISRLPPVNVNHVDVSAFIHELGVFRNEVRAVSELKQEMAQLRQWLEVQNSTKQVEHATKNFDSQVLLGNDPGVPDQSSLMESAAGGEHKTLYSALAAQLNTVEGLKTCSSCQQVCCGYIGCQQVGKVHKYYA